MSNSRISRAARKSIRDWAVASATVTGATHERDGRGNQDAIGCVPRVGRGVRFAAAVADGHGSDASFRSALGSSFAVQASLAVGQEYVAADRTGTSLAIVKNSLETHAPRRLVRDWRTHVDGHLAENPFTDGELQTLDERRGQGGLLAVQRNPYLAYGSTLLGVALTGSFGVMWQIGDGDIVAVAGDGSARRPVPGDDSLLANQTTSLCSDAAWQHFRVAFIAHPEPLVLLSSDGMVNSFADDQGFMQFGSELAGLIAADGLATASQRFDTWLREMSVRGSGDDISLVALCRQDYLRHPRIDPGRRLSATLGGKNA